MGLVAVDHDALNLLVAEVERSAMEKRSEAANLERLIAAVRTSATLVEEEKERRKAGTE